jgi:hypothetical protein
VGGEVGAVKLSVSASSAVTGKLLARDTVIIGIQPAWITQIPLQLSLGYSVGGEVGAVEVCCSCGRLAGGRACAIARYFRRGYHGVVPGGVEARIGLGVRVVPYVVVVRAYYGDLGARRGYLDFQLAVDELGLGPVWVL